MKVALIGATGFVGQAVLNELLQRGQQVTAIVRDSSKIASAANLRPVVADVHDKATLTNSLKGHDVVISAYNAGWTNPNIYDDYLAGSAAIQAAVKASGVKRLIVVGGAGSLYISDNQQLVDTEGFPAEWKPGALAARDYLNIIKAEKELDWTFLSPAIEMHQGTSGKRKGAYRTGLEKPVFDENQRSVISVEDLAVAIADELEHAKHIRQRFTVAY
ncbi:MAG: NAD(P)-dependent oxidoreductase [Chitinophagaceae bacterium]|nr:MAG: NAD(P)-dependent oxidoreductase [Chitinophagaceae bacterium]